MTSRCWQWIRGAAGRIAPLGMAVLVFLLQRPSDYYWE